MERIFKWWMEHDTTCPESVVLDALNEVQIEWRENVNLGLLDMDEVKKDIQRLDRAIEGWVNVYSLDPFSDYEVVGVECALASPILNPSSGNVFRPRLPLVDHGDHLRLARTGEGLGPSVKWKQWPAYQVGKLDYVIRHRKTGVIWAGDHKTSARPQSYLNGMTVDPQMPGYLWMLEQNIRQGRFPGVSSDAPIVGFMYDVSSSSMQNDPSILKNGTISTAKNRKIPSWRFRNTLVGLNINWTDEYKEYFQHCIDTTDDGLYARDFMTVGSDQLDRYGAEIFGEARRLATLRRSAAMAPSADSTYSSHPRVPICRMPGSGCSYRGPCINDGPMVRAEYAIKSGIQWMTGTIDNSQPKNTEGDLGW